jgi:hypothetical protein
MTGAIAGAPPLAPGPLIAATNNNFEGIGQGFVGPSGAFTIGVAPPEKILRRAIEMTKAQRLPDGSYMYGYYLRQRPTHPVNTPGGHYCCILTDQRAGT